MRGGVCKGIEFCQAEKVGFKGCDIHCIASKKAKLDLTGAHDYPPVCIYVVRLYLEMPDTTPVWSTDISANLSSSTTGQTGE